MLIAGQLALEEIVHHRDNLSQHRLAEWRVSLRSHGHFRFIFAEDGNIRLVPEDAVSLVSRSLLENFQLGKARDKAVGGGVSCPGEGLHFGHGDYGALVKRFENAMAVSGGASSFAGVGVGVRRVW